jgi:hypothetical protein
MTSRSHGFRVNDKDNCQKVTCYYITMPDTILLPILLKTLQHVYSEILNIHHTALTLLHQIYICLNLSSLKDAVILSVAMNWRGECIFGLLFNWKDLFLLAYICLCNIRPRVLKSRGTMLKNDASVYYKQLCLE